MSGTRDALTLHDRIDGLAVFLEAFASPTFVFGTMDCTPGVVPFYEFTETAAQFIQAAYDLGWVLTDFDWSSWDDAHRYVGDPAAVEHASIADIERLLTAHIRQDRFCEGHLGAMYDSGHLTAILRRLCAIAEEAEP